MREWLRSPVPRRWVTVVPAGVVMVAWAVWLGWDQHRDVRPDGSTTGPYQAWQVIGLGLTVLAVVYWAASRECGSAAVFGTTTGLTAAAYWDWSDDSSGLFAIGVGMVMVGSLAVTGIVSSLIASRGGRPGAGRSRH
ncbi:hypothetical protein [Streptomyces sp. NPDC018031]|uniref:hypothetical protein n=1 Tax=Streptomyces sp. NPDC018031 TaxID=3365033 RepID=UPI0037ABE3B5